MKSLENIYSMKNYISSDFKHLLWKDECGDDFLIMKWGSVFVWTKTELRLYIWSRAMYSWLKKQGVILWEEPTDDHFVIVGYSGLLGHPFRNLSDSVPVTLGQ